MTWSTAGPPQQGAGAPGGEKPAFRCATSARGRGDPLAGSAAPARRWLLIEHPGPWNEQAMRSRPLDSAAGQSLAAAASGAGARILLIRRPSRARGDVEKVWAVVDHAQEATTWGRWGAPEDLLEAKEGLAGHIEPRGEQGPLFLVCVHGRRDVCCAVRGRPVARVLAARWPRQTWECSHLGGDRFAANVLVVPDGRPTAGSRSRTRSGSWRRTCAVTWTRATCGGPAPTHPPPRLPWSMPCAAGARPVRWTSGRPASGRPPPTSGSSS